MSIPVGTHGLTCLDGEDYAAVALWMQATANATNAALTGVNASLATYLDRPYLSFTNDSVMNVDSASGNVGPEGFIGADMQAGSNTFISNDIPASVPFGYRMPQGIYLMQATVNYTVATPNNNTSRTLMVAGLDRINGVSSISQTYRNLTLTRTLEAGGAGNSGAMSVVGLLEADGVHTTSVFSFFSHANTSSVISIAIGAWRASVLWLGSGLVI